MFRLCRPVPYPSLRNRWLPLRPQLASPPLPSPSLPSPPIPQDYVSESFRFTHNCDVVPSLPPQLIGFHHVAREVWLVDVTEYGDELDEKILMCDDSGEDPR